MSFFEEYAVHPTSLLIVQPCYCRSTLIRTDRGDVAVEELAVGDRVVTVSGEAKPVRWIGTRSYADRFLAANPALHPVCFRAGALGTDRAGTPVPNRDLWVSPKHAMLIDGVLVPAGLLVNGGTIVQPRTGQSVSYFHIELEAHDAIWAEGAPSETFVDDGGRGAFQNAATFAEMYPGATAREPVFCAPRVESGDALEAIRGKLNALSGAIQAAA